LIETDYLVIGSGLAGLYFALRASEHGRVVVATKRAPADANTAFAQGGVAGTLDPDDIDEDAFQRRLFTADIPDPDLVIRTSGEKRISNFLLWQSAYAEYVFMDKLWPDFAGDDLKSAIAEFGGRKRRYGAAG